MRPIISLLTGLVLFFFVFAPVTALPRERESLSPEQIAFGDAIQALTYEEVDQILLEIHEYRLQNPGASEEDLNSLAMTLVQQQVRKPVPHVEVDQEKSWYPLPETVFGLNSLERRLCVLSPLKCLTEYSCANKARTTAPAYFSDGCTNGRCDAFRHTYWNALMVRRIDYDFARTMAAAHEVGIQSNIGTLPFQMDVFNNGWGQSIGQNYTTSRYSDAQVEAVVKQYVLDGKLVIIKNNRIVRSNQ